MLRFCILFAMISLYACASSDMAIREPAAPPPTDDAGAGAGGEPPCDPMEHPWVKALAGGIGETLFAGAGDDLNGLLAGLNPDKAYALVLSEGSYGSVTLPNSAELSIIGACGDSVASEPWSGGTDSRLKIAGMSFQAGLALLEPEAAELLSNNFSNPQGVAVSQTSGSLAFTKNNLTTSLGHGLAIDRLSSVIIGDNHFLGPLGGDGVFSDQQQGDITFEGNHFKAIEGNGITLLRAAPSLSSVIIGDNHFLGPLGGDGVFSDEQEGEFSLLSNRFAVILGNGLTLLNTKPSVASVIIGDNHFLGPLGGDGVFSSNHAALRIQGNRFAQISGNGLSMVEQLSSVIIGDNHFLGPLGGDGVFSSQSGVQSPSRLERNAIDNSGRFGIFIRQPQGAFSLENNLVSATGERGILVQDGTINSGLNLHNNTIESVVGSGLEIIGHLGEISISGNLVDKVKNEPVGGAEPPASGFGIVVLDSPRAEISGNQIRRTDLASIVVDLAQVGGRQLANQPRVVIGSNLFDGLAKYDVVLQNMGNAQTQGDTQTMNSGSAPGFGERFRMRRQRAGHQRCGNGELDEPEACDDGNRIDDDGCTNTCQVARCGDGIRRRDLGPGQEGYEDCDLGGDNALCQECNLRFPQRLAVGGNHACARRGNTIYCWGKNSEGQVTGAITRTPMVAPQPIEFPGTNSALALGASHSCFISGQTSLCIGDSLHDQLFNNGAGYQADFTKDWQTPLRAIAAGGNASCANKDSDWYCAGALSPEEAYREAVPIGANLEVGRMVLGGTHYCVETPTGPACAGDNSRAAISDEPGNPDGLTRIGGEARLRLAVADHVTCLIGEDERVSCRGDYQGGRLGRGGSGRCSQNCARGWDEVANLTEVADLSIGNFHACALDRSGRVTCWGKNQFRALGSGATELRAAPTVQVPLPAIAAQVAVGRHFSCAELVDERIVCWGRNNLGQLGRGETSEPLAVGEVRFP